MRCPRSRTRVRSSGSRRKQGWLGIIDERGCTFRLVHKLFLAAAGLLTEDLVVGLLVELVLVHLAFLVLVQEALVEFHEVGGLDVVSTTELVDFLEKEVKFR